MKSDSSIFKCLYAYTCQCSLRFDLIRLSNMCHLNWSYPSICRLSKAVRLLEESAYPWLSWLLRSFWWQLRPRKWTFQDSISMKKYLECLCPDVFVSTTTITFRSWLIIIFFLPTLLHLLFYLLFHHRSDLYLLRLRSSNRRIFLFLSLLLLFLLFFLFLLFLFVVFDKIGLAVVDDDLLCFGLVCEKISVATEETVDWVEEQIDVAALLEEGH